jgi:hypothetical protein
MRVQINCIATFSRANSEGLGVGKASGTCARNLRITTDQGAKGYQRMRYVSMASLWDVYSEKRQICARRLSLIFPCRTAWDDSPDAFPEVS